MPYSFQDIARDIRNEKCILFLGPELLINAEGKYYKAFFKELADKDQAIYKYFPKDNLFSVSGNYVNLNRTLLVNDLISYYEKAGDEIILNLISQIPFSLIVNVSPDISIEEVFVRNNYTAFESAYFPDPDHYKVSVPNKERPVIYNIFGSIKESQSLIITHDDLFKRIKDLEQKGSIPENIDKHLKKASCYIFLGMKFDTWYYQFLLSILEIDKSPSVRISGPNEVDEDTVSVMNSYFQIIFEKDNPLTLVQNIYDEFVHKNYELRQQNLKFPKGAFYFSYAWNDDTDTNREKLVNMTEAVLVSEEYKMKVFRDRNVLTIQDSIESFMNRIGRGKRVILFVSDKYLKSEYCMYEAWEIFKNSSSQKRVFFATLPDIDWSGKGTRYIQYWIDQKNEIESAIYQLRNDYLAIEKLMARSKKINYIYLFISNFIDQLSDTIRYDFPADFREDNEFQMSAFRDFSKRLTDNLNSG